MHILLGLVLAAGLLYFWLLGHWFARVLVFLGLIPVLGLLVVGLIGGGLHDGPVEIFVGAIGGGVAGWFVSGLPIYYWRRQFAQLQATQQLRRLP
jgi:hypothetical protein